MAGEKITRAEFLEKSAMTTAGLFFTPFLKLLQDRKIDTKTLESMAPMIFAQLKECNEVMMKALLLNKKEAAQKLIHSISELYDTIFPEKSKWLAEVNSGDKLSIAKSEAFCLEIRHATNYKIKLLNVYGFHFFFGGEKTKEEHLSPTKENKELLASIFSADPEVQKNIYNLLAGCTYTQFEVKNSLPSPVSGCLFEEIDGKMIVIIELSGYPIITKANELGNAMMRFLYDKKYKGETLHDSLYFEFQQIGELVSNFFSLKMALESKNQNIISHRLNEIIKDHWRFSTGSYSFINQEVKILGKIVNVEADKYSKAQANLIFSKLIAMNPETLKQLYLSEMKKILQAHIINFEGKLKPTYKIDRNYPRIKQ